MPMDIDYPHSGFDREALSASSAGFDSTPEQPKALARLKRERMEFAIGSVIGLGVAAWVSVAGFNLYNEKPPVILESMRRDFEKNALMSAVNDYVESGQYARRSGEAAQYIPYDAFKIEEDIGQKIAAFEKKAADPGDKFLNAWLPLGTTGAFGLALGSFSLISAFRRTREIGALQRKHDAAVTPAAPGAELV